MKFIIAISFSICQIEFGYYPQIEYNCFSEQSFQFERVKRAKIISLSMQANFSVYNCWAVCIFPQLVVYDSTRKNESQV